MGATTDTYGYVGQSETTFALAGGASTRLSAFDLAGSRISVKDGSTVGYLVPDLHGSVVATEGTGSTAIASALRYDGYGRTAAVALPGGTVALDTRYTGALDLSPDGSALYDIGARFYSPASGAWTQLDTYGGQAQDPASMNRFLYAHANPTMFIDPTGHRIEGPRSGEYEVGTTEDVIERYQDQTPGAGGGTTGGGRVYRPDPGDDIATQDERVYTGWISFDQFTSGGQLKYALEHGEDAFLALFSGEYDDEDAPVIFETADLFHMWLHPDREFGLDRADLIPGDRLDRIETKAAQSADPWLTMWGAGAVAFQPDGIRRGMSSLRDVRNIASGGLKAGLGSPSFRKRYSALLRAFGFQDHHIVPQSLGGHPIWSKAKMDIHSRVNRIFLPRVQGLAPGRSVHNGRHSDSYVLGVEKRLDDILARGSAAGWSADQYQDQLRALMSTYRGGLRRGAINLYE